MSDVFSKRRESLRNHFKKRGIEAFFVTNVHNVSYLTGFRGDSSFLLIHAKGATLLSDSRYKIQIEKDCPQLEAIIREPNTSLFSGIQHLFEPYAKKRIGFESDSVSVATFEKYKKKLNVSKWVPITGLIEEMRHIKDETEIAAIEKAIRCAAYAFNDVLDELRSRKDSQQLTETFVRNRLECAMRFADSDGTPFSTIVAVGENAALPHAIPSKKPIKDGEMLLIDWGASFDGYVCDLTRTLITKKKCSKQMKHVYNIVLEAQKSAIDLIRPGAAAKDVYAAAFNVIENAGFGKFFTHGLGHSLGRVVHESVRLAANSETVLRPGMILTVEPGIYLPNWGGVRIEDDILVTENGCSVLSSFLPKSFEDMRIN